MVNLIIKDKKIPGKKLARKIAYIICHNDAYQQQAMYFYLRGMHQEFERIVKECPDAFEEYRTLNDQAEGVRIV
jgi:recombinational DNA repair protein RecR